MQIKNSFMKQILALLFFLFPFNLFSQNYLFNNGLWGHENIVCCSNIYKPSEIPSELYWKDSIVSICITNDSLSVSKNFQLYEQILDCPYCNHFNISWSTYEGYIISFEGYDYDDERRIIFIVRIYWDGVQVGELNYPFIYNK